MITVKTYGYRANELDNLLKAILAAKATVERIEGCTEYDAHCPTCSNRHLCSDLYSVQEFVERKTQHSNGTK